MRKYVILLVVVVIAGAAVLIYPHYSKSVKSLAGATATTSTTTTTTAPHYPTAPLTGLPDPGGAALHRPALTVKIENTPEAIPQWGISQADLVYEEIVNGGITRLAAVFNSQAPGKIGPVRSVRPTDTQVVFPIGGIFAYSGGAQYAINSIDTAPVKQIDEDTAGNAMFRNPELVAPNNLYGRGPQLFAFGGTPTPPPALFSYRPSTTAAVGAPVTSFVVPFPSIYPVTWTWDTTTASWNRTLFGKLDVTGTGQVESPKNVIVMYVNYVNGIGTMNSYADLQGSGTAMVFSGGKEVVGTWSRGPSEADIVQYKTSSGATIRLTPGQTWVELLNIGATLSITR